MAVVKSTDQDFKELLDKHSKIVVKYYAGWCGSCRLFAPKFNKISNGENYGDVLFLEIDAESSPEARKLAGVSNLPFVATFKDGALNEGVATSKEEKVQTMIDQLN